MSTAGQAPQVPIARKRSFIRTDVALRTPITPQNVGAQPLAVISPRLAALLRRFGSPCYQGTR
jgi:hypothetical protein